VEAVRAAEPVHHVELRRDHHGHESVVLAFPYRAEIVEAVRAIPGRRFDWDTKEWWALQSDATAPYVRGILERHRSLSASPEVHEWLASASSGWFGRVTAARHEQSGWFVLDTVAGELPEPLAADGVERDGSLWLPFTRATADGLMDLTGARMDRRAHRCAQRLQVGIEPAPASLSLIDGTGEPRLQLDVNWDPETVPAFRALPAAEGNWPSVPVDPYLLEPLEDYLRTYGIEVAPAARDVLERLGAEHDAAIGDIRRSRAVSGEPLEVEPALGGELRPFQRAGVAYVLAARRTFLADEQGLGKTVEALAALEADDAFPAIVVCPASLKLNWQRETERWLPHRSLTVVSGTGGVAPSADITIINYDIVHAHRARLALRRARALVLDESHYVKNPRARRTRAVRRLAEDLPRDALRLALTGTPVMNHPEELIAQLRILGRLEEFGSGARFARRFQGAGAEERIHWHLRRTCFVRRAKRDVLPQLPAKRQVVLPVALDNEAEYRRAEQDVIAWLREQPLDLRELDRKVAAALRAERLAQLNVLRRLAVAGKAAAALTWIEDFLASDEPLVVFSGHRSIQQLVIERFPDALHLVGSDSLAGREAAVRAFQAGSGPQLLVAATRIGGQGITLTRATNVAFLDLEWTPAMHDQAEDRLHRIGQQDAVTAWYLLAAGTIDETMAELIARKRGIVGAVTDGRRDDSEALVQGVVRALREGPPRRRLRTVA
jgi:SWI/SNF-related matrix-associated actin-dependent regulator 1 of chromatin subfamily A